MEIIFEIICEIFGALINSKRVPKAVRIAMLSVIALPLIGLLIYLGFKGELAGKIICFIIAGLLLVLFIYIVVRILRGK